MARRPKKKTFSIPKINRDSGGGRFRIPEGSYGMEVTEVVEHESEENTGLKWIFTGTEGKAKGKKFYLYTMYTENSSWKLGDLLEALGQEVPEDDFELDPDDVVGQKITGIVQDDTYQGKVSSKLVDFETSDEAEEDEKPTRGKANGKAKKKAKPSITADEIREMDEEELEDVIKEHELEVDLTEFKTPRRKASAVVSAMEEAGALAE